MDDLSCLSKISMNNIKMPILKYPYPSKENLHNNVTSMKNQNGKDNTMKFKNEDETSSNDSLSQNQYSMDERNGQFDKNENDEISSQFLQVVIKCSGLNDIAGLEEVKQHLKEAIIYPVKYPHLFTDGRTVFTRSLLYGAPGVGKTALVHAVASEANLCLYQISSADISSAWHGQSEKLIRKLFESLGNKRCLLFLDEVDSLCRKSSMNDAIHYRRSTTELLMQMQNFEGSPMFIIGATNCPWDIDPAFVRRFQQMIYVPLPDLPARKNLIIRNIGNNVEMFPNSDFHRFVEATDGLTGSDLKNLIRNAMMIPLREMEMTFYWKETENGYMTPCRELDENAIRCSLVDIPNWKVWCRPLKIDDLWTAYKNTERSVTNEDVQPYIQFRAERMNKI